jgi:parallel beta-helix repeat protein
LLRKTVSGIMLILLLIGMLTLAFNIQPVKASGVIYIRADGSIDPPTAPIQRDGYSYTLTGNISSDTDGIVIERDMITLDGAGYTLQGTSASESKGIALNRMLKVTIKNMKIRAFFLGIYLFYSSYNKILGNNIADNQYGIYLYYSSDDNDISENNISTSPMSGIWIEYMCSNNYLYGNNITANGGFGIVLLRGSNNCNISGNNITANNEKGIWIWAASSDNKIYANNIVANKIYGIDVESSSNNTIYHNNFINNTIQAHTNSITVWDDGYPSGGNYWSDYVGNDTKNGPYQDQPGSDGIGDTPCGIDSNNQDRYPLMYPYGGPLPPTCSLTITATADGTTNPSPGTYTYFQGQTTPIQAIPNNGYELDYWELDGGNVGSTNPYQVLMNADHTLNAVYVYVGVRDVTVTDVVSSKTVVGQGYSININVTAANQGDFTETFNVTLYANTIAITTQTVTLTIGNSATVTFTWNTTGFAKGNYTISAYAWPVPGETYTEDNTLTDGWVIVTIPGDVNGDHVVDISDLVITVNAIPSAPGWPNWNPNVDINGDGACDISDLVICVGNIPSAW